MAARRDATCQEAASPPARTGASDSRLMSSRAVLAFASCCLPIAPALANISHYLSQSDLRPFQFEFEFEFGPQPARPRVGRLLVTRAQPQVAKP